MKILERVFNFLTEEPLTNSTTQSTSPENVLLNPIIELFFFVLLMIGIFVFFFLFSLALWYIISKLEEYTSDKGTA